MTSTARIRRWPDPRPPRRGSARRCPSGRSDLGEPWRTCRPWWSCRGRRRARRYVRHGRRARRASRPTRHAWLSRLGSYSGGGVVVQHVELVRIKLLAGLLEVVRGGDDAVPGVGALSQGQTLALHRVRDDDGGTLLEVP